jgi:hypothetical protein
VKPGTRVRCRRGPQGPDLTLDVLDLSEEGIRLLARGPLARGQQVEVTLEGPGEAPASRHPARVVWSVAAAGGDSCVEARFDEPLSYRTLRGLTSS